MTKQLLALTFALSLLINPALRAEGNHHHERDITVNIKPEHENDHDHCHEKLSAGARLAQFSRKYVRETAFAGGLLIAYNNSNNSRKPFISVQTALITSLMFTAGHALKKTIGFGMYLNNIPKK